jgi:hypothetical protein
MIIDHKLDKFFGPSGSFAGYVLMFAGIPVAISVNPLGVLLIILGCFMNFTHLGAEIDTEKGTYRVYNKVFGLFKLGKTRKLKDVKYISVERFNGGYVTYSRSNRRLDNRFIDYRVNLQGNRQVDKNFIYKNKSYENAQKEAVRLSELLGLPLLKS